MAKKKTEQNCRQHHFHMDSRGDGTHGWARGTILIRCQPLNWTCCAVAVLPILLGAGDAPRCHAGGREGVGTEESSAASFIRCSALPFPPAFVSLQNGVFVDIGGVLGQRRGQRGGSRREDLLTWPRAEHRPSPPLLLCALFWIGLKNTIY